MQELRATFFYLKLVFCLISLIIPFFSVNPYGKLYFQRNSLRALQTTVTELNAIAAAPATGLNCQWNQ